jgi:HK97 family phage major capsid protein
MAEILTTTSPTAWRPDQIAYIDVNDMIPQALPLLAGTPAGVIEGDQPAIRVPFVLDDGAVSFVAEGDTIPENDPTPGEVVITTAKLAQLTKLSRESFQQSANVAQMLYQSMTRALTRKANAAFLGNAVTAGQPTGLLNLAGITQVGELGANLDLISDAMATIVSEGGQPTHILTDPLTWALIAKMKSTSGGALPVLAPATEAPKPRLFGLDVLIDRDIPHVAPNGTTAGSGTLVVVDKRDILTAWSPVAVELSRDVYFDSDSYALRGRLRLGWSPVRPERVAVVTTVIPAAG